MERPDRRTSVARARDDVRPLRNARASFVIVPFERLAHGVTEIEKLVKD